MLRAEGEELQSDLHTGDSDEDRTAQVSITI